MAKATETQIRNTKAAMAEGKPPPKGIRINFGDAEPIQKAEGEKPTGERPADK